MRKIGLALFLTLISSVSLAGEEVWPRGGSVWTFTPAPGVSFSILVPFSVTVHGNVTITSVPFSQTVHGNLTLVAVPFSQTIHGNVTLTGTEYNVRDKLRGTSESCTVLTVAVATGGTLTIPANVVGYELRVDAAATTTEFVYYSCQTIADAVRQSGYQIDKAGKYTDGVILAATTHYFWVSGVYPVRIYARWWLAP